MPNYDDDWGSYNDDYGGSFDPSFVNSLGYGYGYSGGPGRPSDSMNANESAAFKAYLAGISAVPVVGKPAAAVMGSFATGAVHDLAKAVNSEGIGTQYQRLTKLLRVPMSREKAIEAIARTRGLSIAQVTAAVGNGEKGSERETTDHRSNPTPATRQPRDPQAKAMMRSAPDYADTVPTRTRTPAYPPQGTTAGRVTGQTVMPGQAPPGGGGPTYRPGPNGEMIEVIPGGTPGQSQPGQPGGVGQTVMPAPSRDSFMPPGYDATTARLNDRYASIAGRTAAQSAAPNLSPLVNSAQTQLGPMQQATTSMADYARLGPAAQAGQVNIGAAGVASASHLGPAAQATTTQAADSAFRNDQVGALAHFNNLMQGRDSIAAIQGQRQLVWASVGTAVLVSLFPAAIVTV